MASLPTPRRLPPYYAGQFQENERSGSRRIKECLRWLFCFQPKLGGRVSSHLLQAAAASPALAASKTHGQPGELTRLSEEPDEGGKQHHEYVSPAKIEAMGTALYITLSKKKKK
jgi:hypothetical protein